MPRCARIGAVAVVCLCPFVHVLPDYGPLRPCTGLTARDDAVSQARDWAQRLLAISNAHGWMTSALRICWTRWQHADTPGLRLQSVCNNDIEIHSVLFSPARFYTELERTAWPVAPQIKAQGVVEMGVDIKRSRQALSKRGGARQHDVDVLVIGGGPAGHGLPSVQPARGQTRVLLVDKGILRNIGRNCTFGLRRLACRQYRDLREKPKPAVTAWAGCWPSRHGWIGCWSRPGTTSSC